MRMTQNKNDSINAILQHGRVVDKISIFDLVFQIVEMEGSYHLLRTIKIFLNMEISYC